MTNNVYEVVGARFTPQEFELIQMGLTEIATQAKEHGEDAMAGRCIDLIQRLQQYVMAGKGIPPELDKQFAEQFQAAVMDNNTKGYILAIRRWIAARARLEPDPAKAVSELVTKILFAFLEEGRNLLAAGVLSTVEKKLSALAELYDDGEWPGGEDVLTYVRSWVAHGRGNLEKDLPPWDGDADLDEDEE